MRSALIIALSALLVPCTARARVFSYKDSGFAAFVRTSGGLTTLGQKAFKDSIGDASVEGKSIWNYSGEIGFMASLGTDFRVRLGAELLEYRPVAEAPGVNTGGAREFTLDSSVSVFSPNLTLEQSFGTMGNTRYYLLAGAGYSQVTVENKFAMAAGNSYGLTDHKEVTGGNALSYHAGIGIETLFTDNVTCAVDIGYRYLQVKKLTYSADVNSIQIPAGARKGEQALDANGKPRALDLSSLTIGIAFRFYLSFI